MGIGIIKVLGTWEDKSLLYVFQLHQMLIMFELIVFSQGVVYHSGIDAVLSQ